MSAAKVFPMRDPKAPKLSDESDHFTIATGFIRALAVGNVKPVYSLGSLWSCHDGLWIESSLEDAASQVARIFHGLKLCKRGSDFSAIAKVAANMVSDDRFFHEAPAGVATPSGFWRVTDAGQIVQEPLTPEHRQRMRLGADPQFDDEVPMFDALLDHAFGQDSQGQREVLQMAAGGALTRTLWTLRIAILLLGKTATGKTTLLNIIKAVFPNDQVSATNPRRWGNEYYVAALAGKALNIVGELDPNEQIPGGAFKDVVGCDTVEGRHPTGRPFSFVSQAAHFFNANKLPPTVDRSDAFFGRWRILVFENTVPPDRVVPNLAEKIIESEIGGVVAWMLTGAAKLMRTKALPEPPQHRAVVLRWRVSNNSALQFLTDPSTCALNPAYEIGGLRLFDSYKSWAADAGVRAFGRTGFYDAIVEGGGRIGVSVKAASGKSVSVVGVTLAGL